MASPLLSSIDSIWKDSLRNLLIAILLSRKLIRCYHALANMGKLPAEYINLEGPMELTSLKKSTPFRWRYVEMLFYYETFASVF